MPGKWQIFQIRIVSVFWIDYICNKYFGCNDHENDKGIFAVITGHIKLQSAIRYGISRIGIFGSVARGEQQEGSDVDVYVELSSPDLFSLVHIKDELQQLFGCPVDVVRLRDNMNELLKRSIIEEGIYA